MKTALFALLATFPLAAHDLSQLVEANGVDPTHSALLILRLEDGAEWTSGGTRLDQPYSPASTAKIPHTLIALETGFADGPEAPFPWDGTPRWLDSWNQDQTLRSAFHRSCIWVYQEITRSLGHRTMSYWIDTLSYGNGDIGTPDELTNYWLTGTLKISTRDQILFLKKLATETLPLSPDTLRDGKEVMRVASGPDWTLYAKTGWQTEDDATGIGWYVGWLEAQHAGTYLFAFNLDTTSMADLPLRRSVVHAALHSLGHLEVNLESATAISSLTSR